MYCLCTRYCKVKSKHSFTDDIFFNIVAPQKSLGHEVSELTSSRLLKLEMENQSLTKTIEELRSTMDSAEGSTSKILKIEKENQRLSKKVNKN